MSHARAYSPPHCARACTETGTCCLRFRVRREAYGRTATHQPVAALPAARSRSIGNTQRRRRPRKGAQKRRNARRRGGRTFTHPPRAVRASRDLLPSPMNSAARARVRAGKYFLFLRYPALPASSPSPRHGVMHGVWRRECAHPRPTHTMRWASI